METSGNPLPYKEALNRAMQLCSQSEKCLSDLEQKCRDWRLTPEETRKLTGYLIQEKFIDHARYAHGFVQDKFRFNKWGRIKLAYALRQKQIEEAFVRTALAELDEESYRTMLGGLLAAKAKTLKSMDDYTRRQKLMAFGYSHGFEPEVISKMIGEI
ncbi:MAG: RecX family transcriptional regulator [Marinilabiliales bacterium]|nr:RecX family transcriptional regulator [Marinilabiliales bacterium]